MSRRLQAGALAVAARGVTHHQLFVLLRVSQGDCECQ